MCGIAGVYDPNGVDISSIEKISQTIRHRGPDDEGYLFLDAADIMVPLRGEDTIEELTDLAHLKGHKGSIKLALIHRRLSIIDLSPSGHQPMLTPDGTLAIIFNGEIYNYIELRAELEKPGYTFRSGSDTEVILAAYRQWGEQCVMRFVGMWAFVIFDRPKNILFCSRDRFGIKPFYYTERKGSFAFASEIKALLAANNTGPGLHRPNAIEFLVNNNQNFSGSTFISGINELLPGHNLVYNLAGNNSVLKQYYKLNKSDDLNDISHDEAVSMFSRLINDSISLHIRSDVPVGSCLSGGLDSSTIIAHLAEKELPGGLSTFTASFPGTPIDECQYINKLKNLYEFSDHFTYPDLKKLISETDPFLWHQDLPVQSTSMFAQWEVMKLANHHRVKVLLDGQGMDEILGGYSEFVGAYLLGQLSGLHFGKFLRTTKDLRTTYRTSRVANELARALFYYIPGPLRYSIYSSKRTGPSLISPEYKNVIKKIKFRRRISDSIRETSLISIITDTCTASI